MFECDNNADRTLTPFQKTIQLAIEKEVDKRLSDRIKQAETDSEYHRIEMWKAKRELSSFRQEINKIQKETDKKVKDAVKNAQREYWFDCAIGDKVYLIDRKYHRKKCSRCNDSQKIKVLIDEVEVKADCPECGTYEKRQALVVYEYYISEGIVRRLQIEMTDSHKWIRVWLGSTEEEHKYELEYYKIFKTKAEAELKLKEILEEQQEK